MESKSFRSCPPFFYRPLRKVAVVEPTISDEYKLIHLIKVVGVGERHGCA
jgi:hypothetical protein